MEIDRRHNDFKQIVLLIQQAQNRAYQAVNKELVQLYWKVGEYVSQKVEQVEWATA